MHRLPAIAPELNHREKAVEIRKRREGGGGVTYNVPGTHAEPVLVSARMPQGDQAPE